MDDDLLWLLVGGLAVFVLVNRQSPVIPSNEPLQLPGQAAPPMQTSDGSGVTTVFPTQSTGPGTSPASTSTAPTSSGLTPVSPLEPTPAPTPPVATPPISIAPLPPPPLPSSPAPGPVRQSRHDFLAQFFANRQNVL